MVALSISKLRVGAEAYQLSGVAQTLDDYYTGAGEAEGQWVGAGSQALNIDGSVAADDLRAVLAGIAPDAGGLTPNGTHPIAHPRRVPGFDLTFKVPKSVSVLYAVSDDPRVQGAIVEAGNAAVEHVVGWLEREAVRVRRGSNSVPLTDKREAEGGQRDGIRELETTGLVAASFRHRTSRAGDPFLHWHVLAANMAQGVDGKWSSIVHPHLYSHARVAGEVFQAVVRDELTRTLGLEWRPGRHVHEVVGVPDKIMRLFSKRRAEIDAYVAATGTPADGDGHEAAALATRRSKGEQETTNGLSERWRAESLDAGWGPEQAAAILHARTERTEAVPWRLPTTWFDPDGVAHAGERLVGPEEWVADVLRKDLTNESSTFRAVDAVQAVAQRLGEGASVPTIERITNQLLSSIQVLPVGHIYTSRELADVETRFAAALAEPARFDGPNPHLTESVLTATPTLGADQAAAVVTAAGTTSAVSVLIGPAGTGKTYTLNTVRELFETAGWNIRGAAPSARAATELTTGAGIESSTMHSLIRRLQQGTDHLSSTDLLVVDEAGMADIRTLETLTTNAVNAGARVLLVGDHRQLPEVGAGGGFAYATFHAHNVSELNVNRRQKQPWEQHALTAVRDGDVGAAVDAYVKHQRVVIAPDGPAMIDTAVNAWFQARHTGVDLALIAGTNDMVDQLNNAILGRLTAPGGDLHRSAVAEYGGVEWRVGQRVVVRRNYQDPNDWTVKVRNGQTGTVTSAAGDGVMIQLDDTDTPAQLGQGFLAASGRLTSGYASTIHRTQGGTWDAAITVGLDGLYREGAYTAMSRGRHENLIILTDPEARQLAAEQAQDPPRHDRGLRLPTEQLDTPEAELTDRVSRRQGKHLAAHLEPDTDTIDRLANTTPYLELSAAAARAAQIERAADNAVGASIIDASRRLELAERTATHIAPGVTVKALDRHNIGTVVRSSSVEHTARVRFISAEGREAVTTMRWDDLAVTDRDAQPHALTPGAQLWLDSIRNENARMVNTWEATVRCLGSKPGAADLYQRAARLAVDRAAHDLAARQPEWLTNLIGPRPVFPQGATAWDATINDIAQHRLAAGVARIAPGVGLPTARNAELWMGLHRHIANTRTWLNAHPEHAMPEWPILPTQQNLLDRQVAVEAILDTAPPDQRHILAQLTNGQLTLDNTHAALSAAIDGQTDRQRWIVANWPHVVEAHEISAALDRGVFGPDTEVLSAVIADITTEPALAAAAQDQSPWLSAALNQLAEPGQTTLHLRQLSWLEDVANYRTTHGLEEPALSHRDPLGPLPLNPEARTVRQGLLDQLDTQFAIEAPELERHELPQQRSIVDDLVGAELAALDQPGHRHSSAIEGIER